MCPQIQEPNLPYRREAETALCNTAKSGGWGPVRVKIRIHRFRAYVSSRQQRKCRRTGLRPGGATSQHMQCSKKNLLDHLVGGYEERIGYREAEALRCLKVYDQAVDRRLLKWQIAWFLAAQNTIYVGSGLAVHYKWIRSVGGQSTGCYKRRRCEDCRHAVVYQ